MYEQFKEYVKKYDQISLDTIFSDADSERYEEKEKKNMINFCSLVFGIIIFITILFIIKFNIIMKVFGFLLVNVEFQPAFITTGATILASLLAISIT